MGISLDPEDILVSFDVRDLFTSILLGYTSLPDRTGLNPSHIRRLKRGAPVGSPLSQVIAEIFMEHFEKKAFPSDSTITIYGFLRDDFHHASIRSCKNSKEMMDSILAIKEQATVSNKLLVSSEFHAYSWKPGMNVASFIAGLNAIVSKMESMNIALDDATIVGKAVQCLPPEFDSFRQSWRDSAPKFAKLPDLKSQLFACEADQVSHSMQVEASGEAFIGRKPVSVKSDTKFRHKNVVCWNCKKKGHVRSQCLSRKWMTSSMSNLGSKRLGHGGFVVRTNVDIREERNDGWIADSGAFKHITRNRDWFSTFKRMEPCGVRVRDDKLLYAVGLGSIDVEVFNGRTWNASALNNVLFVPEFGSSCLFSLGAAASRGYKTVIDGDKIRLMKGTSAELVGYKDGDLYTLLIRRPLNKSSNPAMSVVHWNFGISGSDMSVSIRSKQ
uniref:CCHC-type domain-containing protein n=1 Tax=Trichuris muris TaxID=70415 RepID=A0A5S6QMP2_TRIMR